jgi:hypothetical protein
MTLKRELLPTFGIPTIPILRLLLGRPRRAFFSSLGAFFGGIFFLGDFAAEDGEEVEKKNEKLKRGCWAKRGFESALLETNTVLQTGVARSRPRGEQASMHWLALGQSGTKDAKREIREILSPSSLSLLCSSPSPPTNSLLFSRVHARRTMSEYAQNGSSANTPGTRTPVEDADMRAESEDEMLWADEHKSALLATRPQEREDSPGDAENDGVPSQVDDVRLCCHSLTSVPSPHG